MAVIKNKRTKLKVDNTMQNVDVVGGEVQPPTPDFTAHVTINNSAVTWVTSYNEYKEHVDADEDVALYADNYNITFYRDTSAEGEVYKGAGMVNLEPNSYATPYYSEYTGTITVSNPYYTPVEETFIPGLFNLSTSAPSIMPYVFNGKKVKSMVYNVNIASGTTLKEFNMSTTADVFGYDVAFYRSSTGIVTLGCFIGDATEPNFNVEFDRTNHKIKVYNRDGVSTKMFLVVKYIDTLF